MPLLKGLSLGYILSLAEGAIIVFWKKATWFYGPANESLSGYDLCDVCVPRGCSCNHEYSKGTIEELGYPAQPPPKDSRWKWVDEEKGVWAIVDEKGREYPCCEWFYDNSNKDKEKY